METIYKKINKEPRFPGDSINQGDETITRMMCAIYFGFINAKYNGIIPNFTEEDIKEVAIEQYKKGLFDYTDGGNLSDGINAVFEWLNNKGYNCNLTRTKNDTDVKEWINRGYAVGLGIKVNSSFYQDKLDGKLDMTNYLGYKGDIGHATNIAKNLTSENEFFISSYFVKSSIYYCDIDEVLQDLDMNTKYIIH